MMVSDLESQIEEIRKRKRHKDIVSEESRRKAWTKAEDNGIVLLPVVKKQVQPISMREDDYTASHCG